MTPQYTVGNKHRSTGSIDTPHPPAMNGFNLPPTMKLKLFSVLTLLATALVARAADIGISLHIGAPAPIIVNEEPPHRERIEERRGPPPGPNHIWIAGHHSWDGRRWNWIEGTWVVP